MKILKSKDDIERFLVRLRKRAGGVSPEIEALTREIIDSVKKKGDSALKRYTKKFDGHRLPPRIKQAEINESAQRVRKCVRDALGLSAERIRDFHMRQMERSWSFKKDGIELGQIIRPLERVGVYVPGGKASYPSTVLMNVIPAQVAGVKEIALCVPTPGGELDPQVAAAVKLLGIKEVYRIGGAQAIAAMAYGTGSIKKVHKITGPGNVFVATAKKMVFGDVDIDMIAGPSEILIIADSSANAAFIAADMLSQAEHDELVSSVLITDSDDLAGRTIAEVAVQLRRLKRKDIAGKALRHYGAVIKTRDMKAAVGLANEIAPEHLEIMTQRPEALLQLVKNAGAIFMGPWTPEPMGDYAAGPNHTLPTGGTARFSSPLGVYDFLKRTSLLCFSRKGFESLSGTVEIIADAEGLEAHANSVRIRRSCR